MKTIKDVHPDLKIFYHIVNDIEKLDEDIPLWKLKPNEKYEYYDNLLSVVRKSSNLAKGLIVLRSKYAVLAVKDWLTEPNNGRYKFNTSSKLLELIRYRMMWTIEEDAEELARFLYRMWLTVKELKGKGVSDWNNEVIDMWLDEYNNLWRKANEYKLKN